MSDHRIREEKYVFTPFSIYSVYIDTLETFYSELLDCYNYENALRLCNVTTDVRYFHVWNKI